MDYRKRYNTREFLKKRIKKVLIPFLCWTVLMIIWKYNIGILKIEKFNIKNIINIFFANSEEGTYYFMFLILGIYITMPVLSILSEERYRNIAWYTVGAIFITQSFLPILLRIFGIKYFGAYEIQYSSYNIPYNYLGQQFSSIEIHLGGYLIFPILGYLLSIQNFTKKQRIIIYTMGILSVVFRYSMTYYWTITSNKINNSLFYYVQFHSVLLACAVFVFVKNIDFTQITKLDNNINLLSTISSCSFGIYLIHKIVMYYEINIFSINLYSWKWRTIGIVTTYTISLSIVYLLKKIPIVKQIVP